MKPTKEQIDAALVTASIYVETCRHDMSRHTANAFATILSAIPTLTEERDTCARQRDAWKDKNAASVEAHAAVLRELEAERAAHAETKRAMIDTWLQKNSTWQSATGHASPEAFEAARVETDEATVRRALQIYADAFGAFSNADRETRRTAGLRAVIKHFAFGARREDRND